MGCYMNDPKFEEYKKKILDYLAKQDDEEQEISKAFCIAEMEVMQKSKGYDVGTIREWKGKKFKKVAPNKWVKVYDKKSRGAMMAIAALRRKAEQCKDSRELMQLVLENRERFSDEKGHPLPFVKEFSDYVSTLNDKLENETKEEAPKTEKKPAEEKTKEKDGKEDERNKLLDAYNKSKDPDERDRIYNELQKLDGNDVKENSEQQSDSDFIQSVVGKDEYKSEDKKTDDWENEDDKEFADSLGLSKEQFDELLMDYKKANKIAPDPKSYMKSFIRYQLEALTVGGYRTNELIQNISQNKSDSGLIAEIMNYTKGLNITPGESVESIENKLKGVMTAKTWGWYEDYKETRKRVEEEWKRQQEQKNKEKEAAEQRYKGNRTPENELLSKVVEDSPIYKAKDFDELGEALKETKTYLFSSHIDVFKKLNFEAVKKSLVGITQIRKDFPMVYEAIGGGGVKTGHLKGTKAWYDPSDRTLNLDNQFYVKDFQDKSTMMIPGNDAASVGVHEATHALMDYLNTQAYGIGVEAIRAYNNGTMVKEIVKNAVNEIKKTPYGKGLKKKQLQEAISGYAAYNEHETVSEAMADYYKYRKNANPLSIAIYKQVKSKYDEFHKGDE